MISPSVEDRLNLYLQAFVSNVPFLTESRLRHHMRFLFEGIDFAGRRVLDIGGGSGIASFYAHVQGASEVACLEPVATGHSGRIMEIYRNVSERLSAHNVHLIPQTLQDFAAASGSFDIIIMSSSVNHLDENACINLGTDPAAADSYCAVFSKVYDLAAQSADVIVSDCSSRNFFSAIGLRNPFAPSIEWFKHQPPDVWARLLCDVGSENPRIRWFWFRRGGALSRLLMSNRVAAFFYISLFALHLTKKPTPQSQAASRRGRNQ